MGRLVDVDELAGASEIGDALGVGHRVPHDWRRRYKDFPRPVAHVSGVYLWVLSEVVAWAETTGRWPRHM